MNVDLVYTIVESDGNVSFRFSDRLETQDRLGFLVSHDYDAAEIPTTLLRHGNFENVKQRYLDDIPKHTQFQQHFPRTRFFLVDITDIAKTEIDEVNKCLTHTGYVNKFLKERNLIPEEFDKYEEI